jgi:hypothetical protein
VCLVLKKECLAYIEETWTDMRPLSLRQKIEEQAAVAHWSPRKKEPAEPISVSGLFHVSNLSCL